MTRKAIGFGNIRRARSAKAPPPWQRALARNQCPRHAGAVSVVRVIHVRLFRRKFWEVFERDGVEPIYFEKRQAIQYAEHRGRLGNALVRIYDERGQIDREIDAPTEDRMLYTSTNSPRPAR